jgi:hypothetical protein
MGKPLIAELIKWKTRWFDVGNVFMVCQLNCLKSALNLFWLTKVVFRSNDQPAADRFSKEVNLAAELFGKLLFEF